MTEVNSVLSAQQLVEQLRNKNRGQNTAETLVSVQVEIQSPKDDSPDFAQEVKVEEEQFSPFQSDIQPKEQPVEKPFLVADELFVADFEVGDSIVMKPLKHIVAKFNKAKVIEVPAGHKKHLVEIQYENGLVTFCDPKDIRSISKRVKK